MKKDYRKEGYQKALADVEKMIKDIDTFEHNYDYPNKWDELKAKMIKTYRDMIIERQAYIDLKIKEIKNE